MALVTHDNILMPEPVGTVTIGNMALDAAGEKASMIFQAPKTGNIDRVCFRLGTVTAATDTDVRLETVDDTTGDPSGTLFGTNTNVTLVAASITTGAWIEVTLTAAAAVTKGQTLALVITPTGTPNYNVNRITNVNTSNFPYSDLFTTVWTKAAQTMLMAVRYDDATYPYIHGIFPIINATSLNVNSGSTPDEVGNLFQVPVPCRLTGFFFDTQTNSSATTGTFRVYDSANNVLISKAIDFTNIAGAGVLRFYWDSTIDLAKDTDYRIAVEMTTATNRAVRYHEVNAAAQRAALQFGSASSGKDFVWTQRTNAGAWSETALRRAGIGLIIDRLDDGASTGGSANYSFS